MDDNLNFEQTVSYIRRSCVLSMCSKSTSLCVRPIVQLMFACGRTTHVICGTLRGQVFMVGLCMYYCYSVHVHTPSIHILC